jgi:hypothetical protein
VHRMSTWRREGQQLGSFCDGSDMYLTEEQYVMVKHVGLNFIIYFVSIISNVQLNVYRYPLLGWTVLKLTGLFVSYGLVKNSSLSL